MSTKAASAITPQLPLRFPSALHQQTRLYSRERKAIRAKKINTRWAMASAGTIRLLVDGHHHRVYRGQEEIVAFLGTLLGEHMHFQAVLRAILEEHDGLTIGQVYTHVRQRHTDPIVQHYLSLEFPFSPMPLQQIIAVSLLQMGYEAKGPRRKQRFYRPALHVEAEEKLGVTVGS